MTLAGILIFIVFLQKQATMQFHHHHSNNNYIRDERSLAPQRQLVILVHFYKKEVFFLVKTNITFDFTTLLNI